MAGDPEPFSEQERNLDMHLAFLENMDCSALSDGLRHHLPGLNLMERQYSLSVLIQLVQATPDDRPWEELREAPEQFVTLPYVSDERVFKRLRRMPELYGLNAKDLYSFVAYLCEAQSHATLNNDEAGAEALQFFTQRIVRVTSYLIRFRSGLRIVPQYHAYGRQAEAALSAKRCIPPPKGPKLQIVPK